MPFSGDTDTMLRTMVTAALAGAREAMRFYRTGAAIDLKPDGSPVTQADQQSEAAILACLAAEFPGTAIIAEEAVAAGRSPAVGGRFFLVDPLDGTKEFVAGNGEFTVNIALVENGEPTAGIVLAPALGLAYAGAGGRAWAGRTGDDLAAVHDWRPIRVRAAGNPLVAVASRSHLTGATEAVLQRAGAGGYRSIGSSLKFCLLATAQADFYPRLSPTMEWDTAAGHAVLRAAGGAVVTLDGHPLVYGKIDVSGMREFENPHFLAAGDADWLACLAANGSRQVGLSRPGRGGHNPAQ